MNLVRRKTASWFAAVALSVVLCGSASAQSPLGPEWEQFLKEKVSFGGFVENATGLSISHGSRFFNTSNRFIMNRTTFQPEFNVEPTDWAKLFVSWRLVKEPRYNAEAKSRRVAVNPKPVEPLNNTFYDEDSPKPWEAVLDLKPTDQLKIRLGRQFISWGETDGLRLLDVINPQDGTFAPALAPNLFDLDETRIPSWGLRLTYTIRPVSNTIFEFVALPGFWDEPKQRVDEILGSNDIASETVRYGRWSSYPETRIPAALGGIGRLYGNPSGPVPVVVPSVSRELPDAGDAWKIGGRITHTIGALNFGLGYIWGFNPQAGDMVFKLKGKGCLPPASGPSCRIGTLGPFLPTSVNIALVNDRTSIFAGHLNYTVGDVAGVPVNTAIRGEVAFYPSEPYNISEFPGRNCATGALTGLRAGPRCKRGVEDSDAVVEKNTLRYAVGFDRTTLIPFLQEDPWRPFRLSLQLFQRVILAHEDGIRVFSTANKIPKISTVLTFRAGTGYYGDTILPDIFFAYDPKGYWAVNPAVSYAPAFNERLKFTLTAAIYGGKDKFSFPGSLSEKDSIFLKMRYQF